MIELALLAMVLALAWAAWPHKPTGAGNSDQDPLAKAQSLSAADRDAEAIAVLEHALLAQPGRGDLADALKLLRPAPGGAGRA